MITFLRTVLIFSLFTSFALAEEPLIYPQEGVQVFLGLDDTSAPTAIADGRAQDLQNIRLSISKNLQQRHGYSLPIPAGTDQFSVGESLDVQDEDFCAVTGIYYTKFSDGVERIVSTCSNRFYYLNSNTTWDPVYGVNITGGKDNQFVFTTALDNIIGTNDVDVPIQYNGTTLSTVSFTGLSNPIQKAKVVVFFKNYLIFANTVENSTEFPTRFRFSNVGTINTWDDDDYIDIGALGGQEINCVAELYDTLFFGLTDSLYKVSLVGGSDTFNVSKISDSIGCIAKNSIQSVFLTNAKNGLVFLDKDKKVYFYDGIVAQDISRLITQSMGALSGSRLPFAVSANTGTDYWLCVTNSSATENNLCFDLQYEIGEWTKHTNVPANAMAKVVDNNVNDRVYFGSYKSFIYNLEDEGLSDDVGTTNPTTVTVDAVNTFTTATASGLTVFYDSALNMVAGSLVGAPIEVVGGTGSGQTNTLADNTTTGLVVTDTFSTALDATSTIQVGSIDSFFTTKWYDFRDPTRLKHFGEVYFWGEADASSTHSLSYAMDLSSDIETLSIALTSSGSDAIWGSAIWGVSLWGSGDDIFRQAKLTTQGRYLRLKWAESDPGETFNIYGWNAVWWQGQIN